jgi:shikimate dehydrogenase
MAGSPHAGDTFGFVGVTASASSINRVFPRWAEVLGLEGIRLEPVDLPLDTPPHVYREVVQGIRDDPRHHGALITSHKVRLLEAARDLFDDLDRYALLCREVSCTSKRDGRLVGHAKDPITSGRSLDEFLPRDHFGRTGGHVLCLGAGGAGLAIALHLLTGSPAGAPERILLVNRSRGRLETCREILEGLEGVTTAIQYEHNADPHRNDRLMADLPPGSLVINATGMGKDVPGSPVTDQGLFPERGFAWDLNYRGDLVFLDQARAQAEGRSLHVEDGWSYFIHGWSEVIAEVFDLELDTETLERLRAAAAEVRT